MTMWIENDELFKRELATGDKWANHVADVLNSMEIPCHATEMVFRDNISQIPEFSENDKDVVLHNPAGFIEVKSRNLSFGADPASYPYDTAFVDTADGWAKKKEQPIAVVLVSQRTSEMLVIPATTEPQWGQESKYDRVRGIFETWLTVHKSHLRPFPELVSHLRSYQSSVV
jgi:hypothetical protein